jgi:hypothetical protein
LIAAVVAFAVFVLAGSFAWRAFDTDAPLTDDGSTGGLSVLNGDPILRLFDPSEAVMPNGSIVSLEEAEARSGRDLFLPPANVMDVAPEIWLDPASGDVTVRYGSTLVIGFGAWEQGQDPATSYARSAASWGVGEISQIAGHPAWLIPANAQAPGQPPVTVVHVARGGWDITLFSTASVEDLVDTAAGLASP